MRCMLTILYLAWLVGWLVGRLVGIILQAGWCRAIGPGTLPGSGEAFATISTGGLPLVGMSLQEWFGCGAGG